MKGIDLDQTFKIFGDFLENQHYQIYQAILFFIIGLSLAKILTRLVVHLFERRLAKKQMLMVIEKSCYYLSIFVVLILSLQKGGVDLKVLLGAAGIFTVAIGFASQTSMSNFISGLFLLGERPFAVGDYIEVEGVKGEVLSIDLLSTKVRTFDNLLLRIPNETMIKTRFINLTYFPIRRIDLFFHLDYYEKMDPVKAVFEKVVSEHLLCLNEPTPRFVVAELNEWGIKIRYSVWTLKENFYSLKTELYEKLLAELQKENIRLAHPYRVVINK